MRYMGGKPRLSKHIVPIIESYREENQVYLEPFVGSGAVIEKIGGMRIGNDILYSLIKMYHKLQGGWIPPDNLTKEEYNVWRYETAYDNNNIHMESFVGIGCSFGGKMWGGYAQGDDRNFCDELQRGLLKQLPLIQDVMFTNIDYKILKPKNMLIYCDPPYAGTTKYKGVGDFNHDIFWDKVREWSKFNTVLVSEYTAPDDFDVVWKKETKTTLTQTTNGKAKRVEKLYKMKGVQ